MKYVRPIRRWGNNSVYCYKHAQEISIYLNHSNYVWTNKPELYSLALAYCGGDATAYHAMLDWMLDNIESVHVPEIYRDSEQSFYQMVRFALERETERLGNVVLHNSHVS